MCLCRTFKAVMYLVSELMSFTVDSVKEITRVDSVKEITRVSVLFFWVKTSTHYQQNSWFVTYFILKNQHKMAICSYVYLGKISKVLVYGNGLVVCTVYTNEITFVKLKLRLDL